LNTNLLRLLLASVLFCFTLPVQALTDKEIDALFNEGLEILEGDDPAQAIAIFEGILRDQPDLNRVRLELALANLRAFNYAEARRQAQLVLNDPSVPNSVVSTVRRFLKEVDKHDKRHVWTPSVSVGLMYDDNVNVSAISSGVIDIGGVTFTIVGNVAPRSDTALQVNAGISHRYLSPNTYKLGGRDIAFAWQSQLSLFRNQYFNEDDFHLNVITARTGPVFLAARKWRFQLPVQVDHVMIGDNSIAVYAGVFPSLTYFYGRLSLTVNGQVQDRDFRRSIDESRDSLYTAGGVSISYRSLDGRFEVGLGVQVFNENAHIDDAGSDRRSNDGEQFTGSANFRPWPNINTFVLASLRKRDFDGVEPVFAVARDEDEKRFAIGANYTFSDSYLNDWVAQASFRHTDNDSNVVLFDYDRDQYLFTLSRSF